MQPTVVDGDFLTVANVAQRVKHQPWIAKWSESGDDAEGIRLTRMIDKAAHIALSVRIDNVTTVILKNVLFSIWQCKK